MSTGLGERIKRRRIELGLSQEDLAKRLGLKSKSTICKIERGDDNLTTTAITKYANALSVTPGYLMGWEDSIVQYVDNSYEVSDPYFADSEEANKAKELYELYDNVSPEVQQAVVLMLKSSQPKP